MKLIDSHCHLDMEPLTSAYEDVIERAAKAEVCGLINVGSSMRGSRFSVDLAEKYPNIWATVGLHPHDAETILDLDAAVEELRTLAKNDKVVAIGEIGLDYFNPETGGEEKPEIKEKQKALFEAQLNLAAEIQKPVVLHIRDAWNDTFSIISNFKLKIKNSREAIGVVHCFTGTPDQAQSFIKLGFYIGFTGFVTFEQSKFDHIRESAKEVSLDRILVETDAPFLAPEPYRGKPNEPAYVVEVAKKIAELKGISVEEVAEAAVKNTEKVFNITRT